MKFRLQGHTTIQGVPIAIENKKGSVRRGTDADGHEWQTKMKHAYGFIKRTEGADGEEVDVFIGPDRDAPNAYIISQNNPDGTYDETKVMLGFRSKTAAKQGYFANYDRRDLLGSMLEMPVETLKMQWGFKMRVSERLPDDMAKARLAGDRYAWAVAAVRSGHPQHQRTLYAILSEREEIAKAIAPGDWELSGDAVELAGGKLFGGDWGLVRHHWGFERTPTIFRKAVDPVEHFAKALRIDALSWAVENLPDPEQRAAAFEAMEAEVR